MHTKIISESRTAFARSGRLFTLLACLFLLPLVSQADDWHFQGVKRIVAVGDIHGAYDAMLATFRQANIIDDSLAWNGGETHLVLTGDLLDRGPGSRQVMDFIMRLETEATAAGGQVHLLLGNHEVMNLVGDLRYVAREEFAAFSDDETELEREHWYQNYRYGSPEVGGGLSVREEFENKAPPGFFGHRRAFRKDGIYASWLLEKPLIIIVNDTAFVHGGVPPYVAEQGISGVNRKLKADLLNFVSAMSALEDAGILSPIDRYREQPFIIAEAIAAGRLDPTLMSSAQLMLQFRNSPLQGPAGPTWYRGTAACSALLQGDDLNHVLQKIGAQRVVFGHSTTATRQVQQRMAGRTIEIDTGMLKSSYGGSGNALIIEDGALTVINQDGGGALSPVTHPVWYGSRSDALDDKAMADILSEGVIVAAESGGLAGQWVQVTANEIAVSARFDELPLEPDFSPELAAYRLDRLLGLYMVPVTVRREYAGRQGSLQYLPTGLISEQERLATGMKDRASCPLDKQVAAMQVFDLLIANPSRSAGSMLYSHNRWQLMLVDNAQGFGTESDLATTRENTELAIGHQWREALEAIDDRQLRASLGDVLGDQRLGALAKRRDALIEYSSR